MSTTTPPITIRYRFGMAPERKIENDPTIIETLKAMNKIDGAVFLGTLLIPSFYGYRIQKSFSSYYFKFGVCAGMFAGAIYAYSRSYARLTGIFIPTPQYSTESQ